MAVCAIISLVATVNIYFSENLLDKRILRALKNRASKDNRSVSSYVRQIFIDHLLDEQEKKENQTWATSTSATSQKTSNSQKKA